MSIKLVERRQLPSPDVLAVNHPAGGIIVVADVRVPDAQLDAFCDYVRRIVALHPDRLRSEVLPQVTAAACDALPVLAPVMTLPVQRSRRHLLGGVVAASVFTAAAVGVVAGAEDYTEQAQQASGPAAIEPVESVEVLFSY